MRNNTCCSLQGSGQFWQRNITILRNQLFQKCAMGCELTEVVAEFRTIC